MEPNNQFNPETDLWSGSQAFAPNIYNQPEDQVSDMATTTDPSGEVDMGFTGWSVSPEQQAAIKELSVQLAWDMSPVVGEGRAVMYADKAAERAAQAFKHGKYFEGAGHTAEQYAEMLGAIPIGGMALGAITDVTRWGKGMYRILNSPQIPMYRPTSITDPALGIHDKPLNVALDMARTERHIIPDTSKGADGHFQGAPKDMNTQMELKQMREHFDYLVDDGLVGWDWGMRVQDDIARNNILRGHSFGYKMDDEEFSHQEYRFMDYETVLAVDRANQRNLGGRSDWTPPELQAMASLSSKGRELFAKNPEKYGNDLQEAMREAAKTVAKPIFTSPGKTAAADISKETIPANKVKSQLEGRGVNKDEMEWTGFNEWISTKKGEVSKAEIEEFFQQNQIEVREVVRGGPKSPINYDSKYAVPEVMEARRNSNGTNHDTGLWLTNDEGTYNSIMDQFPEIRAKEARGEDWEGYLVEQVFGKEPAPTKFSDPNWQLPGGENYRELVLMVPPKKVVYTRENITPMTTEEVLKKRYPEADIRGREQQKFVDYDMSYWFDTPDGVKRLSKNEYMPTDILGEGRVVERTQEKALEQVVKEMNEAQSPKPRYTGGHYPEDDVVAHIRFNERYGTKEIPYSVETKEKVEIIPSNDPYMERVERSERPFKVRIEGSDSHVKGFKTREEAETYVAQNNNPQEHTRKEKILFIEEIQGDWAHKGEAEGFYTAGSRAAEKRMVEIGKRQTQIFNEISEIRREPS